MFFYEYPKQSFLLQNFGPIDKIYKYVIEIHREVMHIRCNPKYASVLLIYLQGGMGVSLLLFTWSVYVFSRPLNKKGNLEFEYREWIMTAKQALGFNRNVCKKETRKPKERRRGRILSWCCCSCYIDGEEAKPNVTIWLFIIIWEKGN